MRETGSEMYGAGSEMYGIGLALARIVQGLRKVEWRTRAESREWSQEIWRSWEMYSDAEVGARCEAGIHADIRGNAENGGRDNCKTQQVCGNRWVRKRVEIVRKRVRLARS